MRPQPFGGELGVARNQGIDDCTMLAEGARHAIAHAKLQAAVGPKPPMHRGGLLDQEAAVRAGVDGEMEQLVLVVIGVRIGGAAGGLAGTVRLFERGVIRGLEFPVKILGSGESAAKLTISAHAFSESAKSAIEAAGGTATVLERTDRWITARPRTRRLPINRELKEARFGKVGGPQRRDEVSS